MGERAELKIRFSQLDPVTKAQVVRTLREAEVLEEKAERTGSEFLRQKAESKVASARTMILYRTRVQAGLVKGEEIVVESARGQVGEARVKVTRGQAQSRVVNEPGRRVNRPARVIVEDTAIYKSKAIDEYAVGQAMRSSDNWRDENVPYGGVVGWLLSKVGIYEKYVKVSVTGEELAAKTEAIVRGVKAEVVEATLNLARMETDGVVVTEAEAEAEVFPPEYWDWYREANDIATPEPPRSEDWTPPEWAQDYMDQMGVEWRGEGK